MTGRGSRSESSASSIQLPSAPAAGIRDDLVAALAAQLGSRREARWIVEDVVAGMAGMAGMAGVAGPAGSGRRRLDGPGLEREARALAARRSAGEPLQYVLGRWPFRTVEVAVDPRVLIPRPETEQVVEVALGELRRLVAKMAGAPRGLRCADLGTGSGVIALSLAVEVGPFCPDLEVWATDASADAVVVAEANRRSLADVDEVAARRVRTAQGDWYAALPPALVGRFDLVVANPPYVAESQFGGLDRTVRDWEPRRALVAPRGACGVEGMADIETIIAGAPEWLAPHGVLVLELDPSQADAAADAARRSGFARADAERDLSGRLRMLVAGR